MTLTAPDPLETLAGAPDAPADGTCVCDGTGWLMVDEDYVRRQANKAQHRAEDGSIPHGLMPALRQSAVPCHVCQPGQYNRWAKGCYRPNHQCAECRPKRRRGRG